MNNFCGNLLSVIEMDKIILRDDSGRKVRQCPMCPYSSHQKGRLRDHMLTHTGERPHPCPYCESYVFPIGFNQVIRPEDVELRFRCEHCNYYAHSAGNLRTHVRKHTGERPFQCTVCDKSFTQKGNALRHLTTHFANNEEECPVARRNRTCDFELYTIYSNLKQELIAEDVLNNSSHPYKCNVCPFVTLLPSVLREHMLVHSVERPYKCPVCSKGFTQKGSVQLHMLHHTGERPHKCPVCHRCYSQKGSMRRHILQHLSNNSNKCPLCSETFELRSEVEVHLIQHTKKDSFYCSLCQATFTSSGHLDEHNKIHHLPASSSSSSQ
ncbi:hypothetical protein NPIL_564021 [Nephila pilipes]|uniref:C2H2-type domain-containing protein n=1 Tax=Nephila pilipes TaxID=299642 RepID=A0A8X6PQU5_NEPPI|nr:hypothetical protein NPIL_564021 [Nephila pilipes]